MGERGPIAEAAVVILLQPVPPSGGLIAARQSQHGTPPKSIINLISREPPVNRIPPLTRLTNQISY